MHVLFYTCTAGLWKIMFFASCIMILALTQKNDQSDSITLGLDYPNSIIQIQTVTVTVLLKHFVICERSIRVV